MVQFRTYSSGAHAYVFEKAENENEIKLTWYIATQIYSTANHF